jgi:hypothetical protein
MGEQKKGLERLKEEIGLIELFIKLTKENLDEFSDLVIPLVEFRLEENKKTVECVETGEPFLSSWYTNAPEIYTAMDLHWYCVASGAFGTGGVEPPSFLDDLERVDQMVVPADVCTLLRLSLFYVEADLVPPPTAFIAGITPCDGIVGLHEAIRNHIEEHTGRKLEMARLREVVEESNRQYELWQEHNELRRSVPCPHGAALAMGAFGVAQGRESGRPRGTAWLRKLVDDAEKRIVEKRPVVPNESIRLLWYDLHPVWFGELIEWLQQEWRAIIIQSYFTYFPYTRVDTSSDDAIWEGLAKRALLDSPMVRQARGTVDVFAQDLVRIVKDFKLDCVIWPGHMGHKDGAAAIPMLKEACREVGVPFLQIGLDTYDRRYTPVDEIKNKISQFFSAMDLG